MADVETKNFNQNGEVIMVTITLEEYRDLCETNGKYNEMFHRHILEERSYENRIADLERQLEAYRTKYKGDM